MKNLFIYLILLSFLFTNCKKDNNPKDDLDCEDMPCTEIFISIKILIKHSNDNTPVTLTNYKVIRISDNKDFTKTDNDLTDNNGYYTIVDDNTAGLIKNSTMEVEFQGFINNTLAVQKRFIIAMDCCHVSLLSGETVTYI
jgi:hypothetical protein